MMFQGDSGGPLSYDHRGQHVLVGVTSYSTVKWKSELELEVEPGVQFELEVEGELESALEIE